MFTKMLFSIFNEKWLKENEIGKYFSDDISIAESIFKNNSIRFTQPVCLNDPLEARPMIVSKNEENKYKYISNGFQYPSLLDLFNICDLMRIRNEYSILSLTKNIQSYDMWNRYSNACRGYYISLNKDIDHQIFKDFNGDVNISHVDYVSDYCINIEDILDDKYLYNESEFVKRVLSMKTLHWSNEIEYRVIKKVSDANRCINNNIYLYDFPFTVVKNVVLGCNIEPKLKRFITKICWDNGIQVYQMFIDVSDNMKMYYVPDSQFRDAPGYLDATGDSFFMTYVDDQKWSEISDLSRLKYYSRYKNQIDALVGQVTYPVKSTGA